MKAFAGVVFLLILTACAQVVEPEEEAPTEVYVVQTNMTPNVSKVTVKPVTAEANISQVNGAETDMFKKYDISEIPMVQELSIGKQHKMLPKLLSLTGNSSCYNMTWEGFDEQVQRWPLEIRKEMRFEYIEVEKFKGWIVSKLFKGRKMVDSQFTVVNIENEIVSCLNAKNFTIDWEKEVEQSN